MEKKKFKCSKCGNTDYQTGELRAAGSFWAKIFNIQNRKFLTISCNKCGYTEVYNKEKSGKMENVLDFFTN